MIAIPLLVLLASAHAGAWKLESLAGLRVGVYSEGVAPGGAPKGCILYLQGLADSIANHEPLFGALSRAGYRVIAFDYPGQGGSAGSMNSVRILSPVGGRVIHEMAFEVWAAKSAGCPKGPPIVMGWSTGGLAAYELARRGAARAAILLAPGLATRTFVGEAAEHPTWLALGKPVITLRSLTRAPAPGAHVDPPKPDSPAQVPLFATNLVVNAKLSRHWKVPARVPGIVFMGTGDTYVDAAANARILAKQAPHFQIQTYPDARHEIDNEIEEVAADVRARIVEFLAGLE